MSATHIEQITHAPEVIIEFVNRLVNQLCEFNGVERRADVRQAITVPVRIQPLDSQFQPIGEVIKAVSRNISGGGIAFILPNPISAKYVQVELTDADKQTIDIVSHVRHCTQHGDFYDIGCRFIADWNKTQESED